MTITNIPPPTSTAATATNNNNVVAANTTENSSVAADGSAASLIVPSFAAWFTLDGLHEIEKSAFPELTGESTTYREYRNYMVSTYRSRPWEYLSLTACRRNLAADVAVLSRIHAFLEQWGLINYAQLTQLNVAQNETHTTATGVLWQLPKDHRLAHGMSLPELAGLELECPSCHRPIGNQAPFYALIDRSNIPDVAAVRCRNCFAEGKLPQDKNSADYVRVDPKQSVLTDWTEEDTLKLLDLMQQQEQQEPDWDQIAEQMGKRKEQCIWHFLRLPFPSTVLEAGSAEERGVASELPMDVASLPFAFVRNPTMALLTFLASQVHPKVAAAAAQEAIKQVSNIPEPELSSDPSSAYLATTTLAIASSRAKQLAEEERARIAQLHDNIVSLQVRKVQQKMAQLEALAKGIEDEKKAVEAQRVAVFYERYKLFSKMKETPNS